MEDKYLVGIDPGANGALCSLNKNQVDSFIEFKKEGLLGYVNYLKSLSTKSTTVALEKVHAMPGQGVKSMFSFGQRLGELEGMLQALGISYIMVRPQEWQRICGIPAKSGKKGIHAILTKTYPTAPLTGPKGGIHDGKCDALGLAHYLRMKQL